MLKSFINNLILFLTSITFQNELFGENQEDDIPRIINGQMTSPGAWPWQVLKYHISENKKTVSPPPHLEQSQKLLGIMRCDFLNLKILPLAQALIKTPNCQLLQENLVLRTISNGKFVVLINGSNPKRWKFCYVNARFLDLRYPHITLLWTPFMHIMRIIDSFNTFFCRLQIKMLLLFQRFLFSCKTQ